MANLTVINHVTLDGVMQAPGRYDEDRRDGFEHGGWAVPYGDAVMAEFMGKGMTGGGALLFGRRTYEDFAAVWPKQEGNPISDAAQRAPEVRRVDDARRSRCRGSTRRCSQGDVAEAVARLKEEADENLAVLGSGELLQTLMRHDLVDEYVLTIHPLVLGLGAPAVRGRRSLALRCSSSNR